MYREAVSGTVKEQLERRTTGELGELALSLSGVVVFRAAVQCDCTGYPTD
jgi:hypothetical protein